MALREHSLESPAPPMPRDWGAYQIGTTVCAVAALGCLVMWFLAEFHHLGAVRTGRVVAALAAVAGFGLYSVLASWSRARREDEEVRERHARAMAAFRQERLPQRSDAERAASAMAAASKAGPLAPMACGTLSEAVNRMLDGVWPLLPDVDRGWVFTQADSLARVWRLPRPTLVEGGQAEIARHLLSHGEKKGRFQVDAYLDQCAVQLVDLDRPGGEPRRCWRCGGSVFLLWAVSGAEGIYEKLSSQAPVGREPGAHAVGVGGAREMMEKAGADSPGEAWFDQAVGRMVSIYLENPRGFVRGSGGAAEQELRRLGEMLNQRGGKDLMRAAHADFAARCTVQGAARNLEFVWDGIGSWMG